jgi:hypothetical protein
MSFGHFNVEPSPVAASIPSATATPAAIVTSDTMCGGGRRIAEA